MRSHVRMKTPLLSLASFFILGMISLLWAANSNETPTSQPARPDMTPVRTPTELKDIRYGAHERNVLDLWLPKSKTPTPLVIFIHGGGFVAGDKSKAKRLPTLKSFLKNGVAVASINYRFAKGEPLGVRASLYDCRRALQFLRYYAQKFNIDKRRVGAFGHSAGAGTSLWLAFSPDAADLKNKDPILRESTRLTVAGALATQATYDLARWAEVFNSPVPIEIPQSVILMGAAVDKDVNSPEVKAIRREVDMLGLMSKDDAPFYAFNYAKNDRIHHPLHIVALAKRAKEVKLEHQTYAPAIKFASPADKKVSMEQFFLKYLKAPVEKDADGNNAPATQKKQ